MDRKKGKKIKPWWTGRENFSHGARERKILVIGNEKEKKSNHSARTGNILIMMSEKWKYWQSMRQIDTETAAWVASFVCFQEADEYNIVSRVQVRCLRCSASELHWSEMIIFITPFFIIHFNQYIAYENDKMVRNVYGNRFWNIFFIRIVMRENTNKNSDVYVILFIYIYLFYLFIYLSIYLFIFFIYLSI